MLRRELSKPRIGASSHGKPDLELDIDKIIEEASLGAIGALAFDAGVAVAGGPAPSKRDICLDIVSGAVAGGAGELVLQVTGSEVLSVVVGALLSGIVFQLAGG